MLYLLLAVHDIVFLLDKCSDVLLMGGGWRGGGIGCGWVGWGVCSVVEIGGVVV